MIFYFITNIIFKYAIFIIKKRFIFNDFIFQKIIILILYFYDLLKSHNKFVYIYIYALV